MMPRLAITFLTIMTLCAVVTSQTKPPANQLPKEVMEAEFSSVDDSGPVKLTAFSNKVVEIAVWAEWCVPCRPLIVALSDLKQEYTDGTVEVIAFTPDDPQSSRAAVGAFLKSNNIDLRAAWIDTEHSRMLLVRPHAIPQILVISNDGGLVRRFIGWNPDNTLSALREAVKEAQSAASAK